MAPTAWRPLWLVTRAAAVAVLALVALLPASAQMENGAGCGDLLPGAAQEGMCLAADPVLGARCSRRDAETTSSDVADWNRRLRDLLTEEEEPRAGAGAWESDLAGLRERVVTMFYHAYDNYMQQAFPHDELLPLSCQAVDNFGGYALTLVDSLDMLAVLGNRSEFSRAVGLLRDRVTFNIDANVSVFETNIRVMGGLLSAHLLASDATLQLMPSYDGCLLDMAVDLGERLLPAFNTATGLPYGTVNLNKGVHRSETSISSSACAGTLLLEFATLSRLSGRPVFERQNVTAHSLFVGNFVADYQDRFLSEMTGWIADGLIVYREDVWEGLEKAPEAFSAMLKGGNFGKTLVAVAEDPTRSKSDLVIRQ